MDEELLRRVPVTIYWHHRGMAHYVMTIGPGNVTPGRTMVGCLRMSEETMVMAERGCLFSFAHGLRRAVGRGDTTGTTATNQHNNT